jgi:response regulator NasT
VTTPSGLRILAADEDHEALERIAGVLHDLGHTVTATAVDLAEATEAVAREDPELSIVVVHEDDEHALGLIEEITAFAAGPVIALVGGEDPDFVARAAERGIYASVGTDDADALQSAIEIAMRRHSEQQRLADQIGRLETALERRAVIERAKGILMERHGLTERPAFERLRTYARSHNLTIIDVSQATCDGRTLPLDDA